MEHLILPHQLVDLRLDLFTQTHRLIRLKRLLLTLKLLQVVTALRIQDPLGFHLSTDLVQLVLLLVDTLLSLLDLSLHIGVVSFLLLRLYLQCFVLFNYPLVLFFKLLVFGLKFQIRFTDTL